MSAVCRSRGFTLIELVVSLTIMAMISAAVLSALRTGLLVWDKANHHIDDLRQSRILVELLKNSVGGALPFMYTLRNTGTPVRKLAFDGASDSIRFVSRSSFKDGPDSLPRWIEIRWIKRPDGTGGELVGEERGVLPPDNLPRETPYWTGQLLEADRCAFDFLENSSRLQAATWMPEWHPVGEHLPAAVRMRCMRQSKDIVSVIPLDYAPSYAAGLRLN
jgi:prepilin-type N-terminal cleavage/methylation domain-containing protein